MQQLPLPGGMSNTFYTFSCGYVSGRKWWERDFNNNVAPSGVLICLLSGTDGDLLLDYVMTTSGPVFRSLSCSAVYL